MTAGENAPRHLRGLEEEEEEEEEEANDGVWIRCMPMLVLS